MAGLGSIDVHEHHGDVPNTQMPRCSLSWWEGSGRNPREEASWGEPSTCGVSLVTLATALGERAPLYTPITQRVILSFCEKELERKRKGRFQKQEVAS